MYWARTCIWLWLATDTRTSPSLLKRGPHASAIMLSGVGFTNPRTQTPAKNANARPAVARPSQRNFGSAVCGFAISAGVITGAAEPFLAGEF